MTIPKGILTAITGVAGSGKSSLVYHEFVKQYPEAIVIDQKPKRLDPSTPNIIPTMKVFFDFSAKIHIPLGFSGENERKEAIFRLKQMGLIDTTKIKFDN